MALDAAAVALGDRARLAPWLVEDHGTGNRLDGDRAVERLAPSWSTTTWSSSTGAPSR
ncbi:MAG: hypothetical protein OXQ31_05030 [Spirochaetaceae bacterium]|nr:hypothetical protein [Spirochaetaceae bacterium]